jgi:hypothetical protein
MAPNCDRQIGDKFESRYRGRAGVRFCASAESNPLRVDKKKKDDCISTMSVLLVISSRPRLSILSKVDTFATGMSIAWCHENEKAVHCKTPT